MALDETRSKLKATTSEWFAEEKKLQAQLTAAQAKLALMLASDTVVDSITTPVEPIADRTEFAREFTASQVAQAQADVDRIEADSGAAKMKTAASRKAKKAADSVGEATENAGESIGDAKDSAAESIGDAKDSAAESIAKARESLGDAIAGKKKKK